MSRSGSLRTPHRPSSTDPWVPIARVFRIVSRTAIRPRKSRCSGIQQRAELDRRTFRSKSRSRSLGHEPIRRASTISHEDVERVMTWVRESGIRWGIDGEHRARFGLPALEENMAFGLKRMLLGTAMPQGGICFQYFAIRRPMDSTPMQSDVLWLSANSSSRQIRLYQPRNLTQWFQIYPASWKESALYRTKMLGSPWRSPVH